MIPCERPNSAGIMVLVMSSRRKPSHCASDVIMIVSLVISIFSRYFVGTNYKIVGTMARDKWIKIRVNENEQAALQRVAGARKLSEYVRTLALLSAKHQLHSAQSQTALPPALPPQET